MEPIVRSIIGTGLRPEANLLAPMHITDPLSRTQPNEDEHP